jgi:hypothetical protein
MFHNRQLSIPRIEDDFKIGTGSGTGIGAGQSLNPSGAMDESDYNSDMQRNSLFGTFCFIPFSCTLSCTFHAIDFLAYVEYLFLVVWTTGQPFFCYLLIADCLLVTTLSLPFPPLSPLFSLYSTASTHTHPIRRDTA